MQWFWAAGDDKASTFRSCDKHFWLFSPLYKSYNDQTYQDGNIASTNLTMQGMIASTPGDVTFMTFPCFLLLW